MPGHHRKVSLFTLALAGVAWGATVGPASGETIRLPVTRDTWFSNVGDEANYNMGGSAQLKLKSYQELSLVDIDPAPLKGRIVTGATLHLRVNGQEILRRITVSSFASDWIEGTSPRYGVQEGSSTFNRRRHPDLLWASPGSDLTAVMLGQGGTVWRSTDAEPPDANRWQQIAVDPRVLAARAAGISFGLIVFDDTGSEWTRQGESFTAKHMPNRFVHSRHAGASNAPYLLVTVEGTDAQPPAAPGAISADATGLPAGELRLNWASPADAGAGTAGFFVEVEGKPVPQYLVPAAAKPGQNVTMHLRDLQLQPGQSIGVRVRAVDGAGNIGPATETMATVSARRVEPLAAAVPPALAAGGTLPKIAGAEMAIIDALDKVQPVTGAMIPPQEPGYLAANHLWSAAEKKIHLYAARNEFVSFQILLRGRVENVTASLEFPTAAAAPQSEFYRYRHVGTDAGPLPDPVLPLTGARAAFSVPTPDEKISGQTSGSLLCEVFVPHGAAAGPLAGTLTLKAGAQTLQLPVSLTVWDFTLPDQLSFLPEMNCYSLPKNERDYYRLAHRHRTVLNRVPYSQSGSIDTGCAPKWDGRQFDWAAWDARFGPLLDGSLFADLPRRSVPIECFYLPLHENWPATMGANYNGDYWADRAFPASYRQTFIDASRQYAEHLNVKGWGQTLFQCFLNDKVNFKSRGWSRGASPWLLDEPANFQDYWALAYFGQAFHIGIGQARGPAKLIYRCDISRPEWQRDLLDDVLDYNVVSGGAFQRYREFVVDRKARFGQVVVVYGGTNHPAKSNVQPAAWCVDAWSRGLDGVVPWQTVGGEAAWQTGDPLAVFYPGASQGYDGAIPSIRLKGYLRGQQDVEYLTLLSKLEQQSQQVMGERARALIGLVGQRQSTGYTGGEDAGVVDFGALKPQDLWKLRMSVAHRLNAARPLPQRQLVVWQTPARKPIDVAVNYLPASDAAIASGRPVASGFVATASSSSTGGPQVKTVQGRAAVRDALIDPAQANKPLGAEPRDNRVGRSDQTNALLVRFDLTGLKLPPQAKVRRATVTLCCWDPAGKGKAKVVAAPLLVDWDEATATWNAPLRGRSWRSGASFSLAGDCGPAGEATIVPPQPDKDVFDPPLEYHFDVTAAAQSWLSGKLANYGVAIAPVIDRAVDDGLHYRFQVMAAEYREPKYTPKLTLELEP